MTNLNPLALSDGLNTKSDDLLEVLTKLAHILSQPLTSLRGSVEVALMGQLNESEFRRLLEFSLQESNRMAEALEALRDVLEMEVPSRNIQPVSWTRCVKKSLEVATSVDEDLCRRLVVRLPDEIYVKANPRWLDIATQRLVRGAVRAAQSKRAVQVELTLKDETASLSVCSKSKPSESIRGTTQPNVSLSPDELGLGEASRLVVRRAIEGQGGWLEISRPREAVCCCHVHLPLASFEAEGKDRSYMPRESGS